MISLIVDKFTYRIFCKVSPVINISLTMVLMLGYKSECPHLQMNPRSFPGHWSLSTSHWPGAQDKQLQSSSQFMLSTLGNVKLSRRAESKLSRSDLANCITLISAILFELYLFLRQDSLYFEQTPNVQCPVAISSALRLRNPAPNECCKRPAERPANRPAELIQHPRLSFT